MPQSSGKANPVEFKHFAQEECESYYVLKSITETKKQLEEQYRRSEEEHGVFKRRQHYLFWRTLVNYCLIAKRALVWVAMFFLHGFPFGYTGLLGNIRTLLKEPQFRPLRIAFFTWILFLASLLTVGFFAFRQVQPLFAAVNTWPFTTASDYTYTASKIDVTGGVATLVAVDQTDNDNTSSGFGGGTHSGTQWDAGNSWLENDGTTAALPNNAVTTSWFNMNGNVLLYHFDETSWNGTANEVVDSSGQGSHLTGQNSISTDSAGKFGYAASTTAASLHYAYKSIANYRSGDSQGTMSAWIKITNTADYRYIFSSNDEGAANTSLLGFGVSDTEQLWVYQVNADTADFVLTTNAIPTGRWVHVALVSTGSAYKLYVDGSDQALTVSGGANSGDWFADTSLRDNIAIAANRYNATASYFEGLIDEFALFNRTLSTEEIQNLYMGQSFSYQGTFSSRIIDVGTSTSWTSLAFTGSQPFFKELPNSDGIETGYTAGNADMSNTTLLFHMNEAAGATTFTDNSGASTNFTCSGNDCPTAGGLGVFNKSVEFTTTYAGGSYDRISVNSFNPAGYSALSVEGWVYLKSYLTTNQDNVSHIIVKETGVSEDCTTTTVFRLDVFNNHTSSAASYRRKLEFGVNTTSGRSSAVSANDVPLGQWVHVAGVWNGSTIQTYINGVADGTSANRTGTLPSYTSDTNIGIRATCSSEYSLQHLTALNGKIDELAVYDRALSSSEITAHFRRSANRLKFQVRSCDDAACSGESFVGPGNSTTTYFSELSSTALTPTTSLIFANAVTSNRYFQYNAFLESMVTSSVPEVSSISIAPTHYPGDTPAIFNKTGLAYTTLSSFTETLGGGNAGSVRYQISTNTSTWYYHNGTTWTTGSGYSQTNNASTISSNISTFPGVVGTGDFFFNAFLVSNGTQQVELSQIDLDYQATPPGVTVSQPGTITTTTEAGITDTYTLVLDTEPTNNVTIAVSPDSNSSVSTSSIVFTTSNWNTAVTVTVTAVNDSIAEGTATSTISHTAVSSDSNYNGISISSVQNGITDNDTAGVTISTTSVNVTEGSATSTYTVVLTSQPTSTVSIAVANSSSQVTMSTSTITFTSSTWSSAVTVIVTAVDDDDAEGNHTATITHTVTSANWNYNGISVNSVTANITDNDSAGVSISESGGSTAVAEGSTTDTYTIRLTTRPTATVTVNLTASSEVTLSASSLSFTTTNWSTAQTVTVTAVNDSIAEGTHTGTASHTGSSADANYSGISISSVTATITDNDTAGVTISEPGSGTTTTESGITDTYTVVLDTQPTSTVFIALSADTHSSLSTSSITFTSSTWNTPATVTVTAVDDSIAEADHVSTITHTSSSTIANYHNISISSVSNTITDNDTAGVTVTESSASTVVVEAGDTDTYTLVLTSQPTSTVTIAIANANGQVSMSTSSVSFTSSTWSTPVTVTVTAVDDLVAEDTHSGSITHRVTSNNWNYNGISVTSVLASVRDNDSVGAPAPAIAPVIADLPADTTERTADLPPAEAEAAQTAAQELRPQERTMEPGEVQPLPGNANHSVVVSQATAQAAEIVIRSNPITLYLQKGETKEADVNEDGFPDVRVTYRGFGVDGKPQFTFVALTSAFEERRPVRINGGSLTTLDRKITVQLRASGAVQIAISESPTFALASYMPFTSTTTWELQGDPGVKTIYIRFRSGHGGFVDSSDSITLLDPEVLAATTMKDGTIVKAAGKPEVYLLLEKKLHFIPTEKIFLALRFLWNWVEEVSEIRLLGFEKGPAITTRPVNTFVKSLDGKIFYRIEADSRRPERKIKRRVTNPERIADAYRIDRIPMLARGEAYPDGSPLTLPSSSAPVASPEKSNSTPSIQPLITKPLQVGSVGQDVIHLQQLLRRLGYFTYPTDTGRYATVTAEAVKKFQKDQQLPVTGRVDAATIKALQIAR